MHLPSKCSDRDRKPPEAVGTANPAPVNERDLVANKTEGEWE